MMEDKDKDKVLNLLTTTQLLVFTCVWANHKFVSMIPTTFRISNWKLEMICYDRCPIYVQ